MLYHRIKSNNWNNVVSPVCTVFVILRWYSKNEIPVAALELCQLKNKQFFPEFVKFSTKHEDKLFTLNYYMVSRTFLLIFHAGLRRLGSNNFRNSNYKEKTAGSARVFRLFFRFLWLWFKLAFLQLIWKASLIFKSNLELALSFILKQRELYESKHLYNTPCNRFYNNYVINICPRQLLWLI